MAVRTNQEGVRAAQDAIARFGKGKGRRSKYNASPTIVDGIRFDSAKEARRYGELKVLERVGTIEKLELQPEYELFVVDVSVGAHLMAAAMKLRGLPPSLRTTKIGMWRGDFRYWEHSKAGTMTTRVVEDVKGFKTPLYRWKKKHVEAQYGIQIREI